MKLGISLGHLGSTELDLKLDLIKHAEKLGYDCVWTAETWGHDALVPLAYIAANTSKIGLGTSIIQMGGRSPALTANTMTTLDKLSGGRVRVGLGLSGPQVIEGFHGTPFGPPAQRTREYMQIMRKVWAREEPLAHDGRAFQLPYTGPDSTGLGKPLKSILHGRQLPILVGAIGPVNLRNAAEIGDGWIATRVSPQRLDAYLPAIEEGFKRAGGGKSWDDFEIVATAQTIVTDDVQAGFDSMKEQIALYVGGMGAREQNFHNQQMRSYGYVDAAARIQDLFLAGQKREAEEAVPDEFCDEIALVGPPQRIRERYRDWEDSRVSMMNLSKDAQPAAIELMAELTGASKGAPAAARA